MSSKSLLVTLQETLQELREKLRHEMEAIIRCAERKEQLRQSLEFAKQQERAAAYEDEEAVRKKREVLDLYNSMVEKPHVLLDKIDKLGKQQFVTYQRRERAEEATRNVQHTLQQVETQLALTEEDRNATQKQIEECVMIIGQQNK